MGQVAGNAKKLTSHSWVHLIGLLGVLGILIGVGIAIPRPAAQAIHHAVGGDWPTYLENVARDGYNSAETIINPTTASKLKLHWTRTVGSQVATEPVEVNGILYWGSWDGLEHASDPSTGKDVWTANLGNVLTCRNTTTRGVTSTAMIASVSFKGTMTSVLFVGGGNATLYALDANKGTILWQTALGTVPHYFLYASPIVYNGSVYMGVSSFSDCPLVQGQMVQLNASTGAIQHTFNVVPNGCLGGTVWGSPALDTSTGLLYFGTGNEGKCSTTETMTDAVVALHTADLSVAGVWQIPVSQQYADGDFGSTPTLFSATIKGSAHQMLGLVDKNGYYYALDRTNVSAGPLWQVQLSAPGNVPDHGQGSIASSAWDGTRLYAAGAATTVGGASCGGSLRALDPTSGKFLWEYCFSKAVLAPVISVPGLAVVGAGNSIFVIDATSGKRLFSYGDKTTGSRFWGAATISNGVLYIGNMDGNSFAFGM